MDDLNIRRDHHAGRITLNRPKALNALSHEMANAIKAALDGWRDDPAVRLVIIDAEGDRAFCAGGDIAAVYHGGRAGDHGIGQQFFADEYRMNATIRDFPKPITAFMQGFVMGGGVGIGGHASHRVVGDTTQVAMPESGIGLIPDVGGTWLLARAPGRIGEYLGLTGARMGAGDAIHAGFADIYLPEAEWAAVKEQLAETGDISVLKRGTLPPAALESRDLSAFGGRTVEDIIGALEHAGDAEALKVMRRNSPLSMAATLAMVRAARGDRRMQESLSREYRFTHRATAESDFLEGVRAQIIDKDRNPAWKAAADPAMVDAMLADLGPNELTWEEQA
ncbi:MULTISPECIES: enoyl-CoA hydratase/isomerase family protein [unclassified Paracoccus (in: a-proteobacteria)]|uniref:enoyl-CoA hydratase/isomerase family protein n=1 Tax=unclassified Paracoccus (in: a-proteobacteria) TaxID=2688777 RepID=UPI0016030528|nr:MULTISPECIES: enoyl-CoA hydratase/isomerase family protein [unclassified Paracoccus (in: a-proteobacteria)]MBB1490477.1 enoyl-CoA hydratase/isomerase family protein [Paracoccus sp. MC1854]MBB1497320.1 enoyl-CoA hydratase/isomerase family protein [Paracoccus sp. MC1862]QQO44716.1 enoyl-CoA hydratase/isomerase family protein [Paracoccus sp. MC1862]